jgi:hypothetical protein
MTAFLLIAVLIGAFVAGAFVTERLERRSDKEWQEWRKR